MGTRVKWEMAHVERASKRDFDGNIVALEVETGGRWRCGYVHADVWEHSGTAKPRTLAAAKKAALKAARRLAKGET